ncbi:MAG: MmcQ/YjbR family DNA-binding protein [Pseudomonadota bacterium]
MLGSERMKALCRTMRAATEQVQWGDAVVFKVGGKMFAVTRLAEDSRYSFKVDPDRFLELTGVPGIAPAPYLARAKWVQVDPASCPLPAQDLEALLRHSYALVVAKLTKKLQREIEQQNEGGGDEQGRRPLDS